MPTSALGALCRPSGYAAPAWRRPVARGGAPGGCGIISVVCLP